MKKPYNSILTGILIILSLANMAHGSNLSTADESLNENNTGSYNFFLPPTPVDYRVIERYGELPELKTEEQKLNWSNKIKELKTALETELFFVYFFPGGKIITYGENSRGYLVVALYNNISIDRLEIYDIYHLIDEEAKKIGIQGVPVEFGEADFPVEQRSWASEMKERRASWGTSKRDIIATYGKLPELKTQEQINKWFNIDQGKIIDGLRENFTKKYFIPAGPLIGLGTDYPDGYIEAVVDRNLTVDKKLLDEIYGVIDKEARKEGFEDVPVIFVFGDPLIPAFRVDPGTSSNNEKPSANETISQPPVESNKSTPGFGFLGGLILLLITGALFSRK